MARRTSARSSRKSSVITVNMKGVEGKRPLVAAGEYECEVLKIEKKKGDKAEFLAWEFGIDESDDDHPGDKLYYNTSLSEQSLWNLKGLLEALDVEVPDDEMDLDLEELVGQKVKLIVEHEDYQGRPQARVVDFEKLEEEPKRGRDRGSRDRGREKDDKRSSKKGPKPLTQDEVNDMDLEELETLIGEYKLDVDDKDLKVLRKARAAVIDALETEKLLKD